MPPNPPTPNISDEVQVLLNSAGFTPDPTSPEPPESAGPVPLLEDLSVSAWVEPSWFQLLLHMIRVGYDNVLTGPAATGKSSAVVMAARALNAELARISASKNMDETQFLGKDHLRTVSSGLESFFKDGLFIQTARAATEEFERAVAEKREPRLFIFNIEEANALDAGTTMFMNSWTDGWGAVLLETGEIIRRPPNFRIIITMNDGYVGTRSQNEALYRSRFFVIECPELAADPEKKILAKRFPSLTPKQVEAFVLMANTVRANRKNGGHEYDASLRCIFQAVKLFDYLTFHQGKPPSPEAILDACRITFMPKVGNPHSFGPLRSTMETAMRSNLTRLFPKVK